MKVKKVLNNSLVLVDDNGEEKIIMGKGIGFSLKKDESVDKVNIQKEFVINNLNSDIKNNYLELLQKTDENITQVTEIIVEYVQSKMDMKLNQQLFFTLLDHINYSIQRVEEDIVLQNRLLWEIQKYYPKEYELGEKAIQIIEDNLTIRLPIEEAGNIAFHIVNAETETSDFENAAQSVRIMKEIFNIVQYSFVEVDIKENSTNYLRFMTHMQFFLQRIFDNKCLTNGDDFMINQMKNRYPKSFEVATKIKRYILDELNFEIPNEELLYLVVHISRITV